MINIATIHHETSRFMRIQNDYLKRNTSEDFRVFCGISNIKPTVAHYKICDFSGFSNQHWARLDNLASNICLESSDDDVIVFMDGDAFPIVEWNISLRNLLSDYDLTAIVRKENPEKLLPSEHSGYPHPCFCATTVGFWKHNNLSWRLDPHTKAETAGVVMHRRLKNLGISWKPLLRSNAINIHPLYFGIYENLIYHHGAGNRDVYDSIDIWSRPGLGSTVDLDLRYPNIVNFNNKLSSLVYDEIYKDDYFINNFLAGIK